MLELITAVTRQVWDKLWTSFQPFTESPQTQKYMHKLKCSIWNKSFERSIHFDLGTKSPKLSSWCWFIATPTRCLLHGQFLINRYNLENIIIYAVYFVVLIKFLRIYQDVERKLLQWVTVCVRRPATHTPQLKHLTLNCRTSKTK